MTTARVRSIASLPSAGALDGTEILPVVKNGASLGARAGDLAALSAGTYSGFVGVPIPRGNRDTSGDTASSPGLAYPLPGVIRDLFQVGPRDPFYALGRQRRWGIQNRVDRGDCLAGLQALLNDGEDIALGCGGFQLSDALVMKRQASTIFGLNRFGFEGGKYGSSLCASFGEPGVPSFNLGALGVVVPTAECEVARVSFQFYQRPNGAGSGPSGSLLFKDIIQYPWAINMRDASRCRLSDIRVERGWDGVKGVATSSEAGGAYIINGLELGCFHNPFWFDAPAKDFYFIDRVSTWVFGIVYRTDLTELAYANPAISILGTQDGGSFGRIVLWKNRLVLNSSSGLSVHGGLIDLDGGGATVEFNGGDWNIDNILSLSDDDRVSAVTINAGQVTIGNLDLKMIVDSPKPMLKVNGGVVQVANPIFKARPWPAGHPLAGQATQQPHALVSGGSLNLKGPRHVGVSNVVRSTPMIDQSGSGRLMVMAGMPEDRGTGSGAYIRTQTDERHVIANNQFVGWDKVETQSIVSGIHTPNGSINAIIKSN